MNLTRRIRFKRQVSLAPLFSLPVQLQNYPSLTIPIKQFEILQNVPKVCDEPTPRPLNSLLE